MGRDDECGHGTERVKAAPRCAFVGRAGPRGSGRISGAKAAGGEGREAVELREHVEELRQKREEITAPHLDQAAAIQELEKRAEAEIARIENQRYEQISILDKLIEKARASWPRKSKNGLQNWPGMWPGGWRHCSAKARRNCQRKTRLPGSRNRPVRQLSPPKRV